MESYDKMVHFDFTGREGGIWSNSKKQKIREAMALDQQMHEEHER